MARRPRSRRPARLPAGVSRRAKVVWMSLTAAMTAVGGLLVVADGRPAPRADGLALPPLVAAGSPQGIESIFKTRMALDKGRWKAIIIHASGEPFGSPAAIEAEHQKLRFRGLGHHFVIGNGAGMDDGELHVGYRWLDQLPGAHAAGPKGDWYNANAISICLVGNGDRQTFTKPQIARLESLVSALCRELGIPADKVLLHSAIAPTSDPGRLFPEALLRQHLADGN